MNNNNDDALVLTWTIDGTEDQVNIFAQRPRLSRTERVQLMDFVNTVKGYSAPAMVNRYRVLMLMDDHEVDSVQKLARLAHTTPWMIANVLIGFREAGVEGALNGQWIDSATRVSDHEIARRSAEGLARRMASYVHPAPPTFEDPYTRVPEERFPGLTEFMAGRLNGRVSAATAAQVFADYVDGAVHVLRNQDEFINSSALHTLADGHAEALTLMNDLVTVGQEYLTLHGRADLTSPWAGMLTSVVLPALMDTGSPAARRLAGLVTPLYAELYLAYRAVADQFPHTTIATVAKAITKAREVPLSTLTLRTAVDQCRLVDPDLDTQPVAHGQFVPGHINWANGVCTVVAEAHVAEAALRVDASAVSGGAQAAQEASPEATPADAQPTDAEDVLVDYRPTAYDLDVADRLAAPVQSGGLVPVATVQALRDLRALAEAVGADGPRTAGELAEAAHLDVGRVCSLAEACGYMGAAGALAERTEDGWRLPADAPALAQAAGTVRLRSWAEAFTDVGEALDNLGADREALRTFLGDVHAVGELPVNPMDALYALAVLTALEVDVPDHTVADDLWAEVLRANVLGGGLGDALGAAALDYAVLAKLRGLRTEFADRRAAEAARAEAEQRSAEEAKARARTKARAKAKAKAEAKAEPPQVPLGDLDARLASMERLLMDIRGAQQGVVDHEYAAAVEDFATTRVNGVIALDHVNTTLAVFGWRLDIVDGLLTPVHIGRGDR